MASNLIKFRYAGVDLVFQNRDAFNEWCDYHIEKYASTSYRNINFNPSTFFSELKSSEVERFASRIDRASTLPPIRDEPAGRFLFRLGELDHHLFSEVISVWGSYGRSTLGRGGLQDNRDSHLVAMIAVARAGSIPLEAEHLDNLIEEQRRAQAELIETRAQYIEYMNLAASVNYWSEKRTEHTLGQERYLRWARRFGAVFFICSIALPVLFITNGVSWLSDRVGSGNQHETALFYLMVGLYVFLLSSGLWCLRILVKLYLSEHHLMSDAFERLTMVKTYLALHRENAVAAEDRTIVLSALFRTSQDGVVKEEGIDPSIPHLLARALAKP